MISFMKRKLVVSGTISKLPPLWSPLSQEVSYARVTVVTQRSPERKHLSFSSSRGLRDINRNCSKPLETRFELLTKAQKSPDDDLGSNVYGLALGPVVLFSIWNGKWCLKVNNWLIQICLPVCLVGVGGRRGTVGEGMRRTRWKQKRRWWKLINIIFHKGYFYLFLGLGVLWWLHGPYRILAKICRRGKRLFQVYHSLCRIIVTEHNTTPVFWKNDFLFRPVDIWLRHFIQPFKNSYGWNLYREFWRVWVPLLLAPRFGQFNIRSKQLPCFTLIGMGQVVWTPCQTWRRVGWSRFSSTRWSSSSPARRTSSPSSASSQSLTLLRQSVDMSSSQGV